MLGRVYKERRIFETKDFGIPPILYSSVYYSPSRCASLQAVI
jgi:hypothetical protein